MLVKLLLKRQNLQPVLTSVRVVTVGLYERLPWDSGCSSFCKLAFKSFEEVTSPQVGDEKFEELLHTVNIDGMLVESYWAQQDIMRN